MRIPVDPQCPADLGAPGPTANRPAPLPARQGLGDFRRHRQCNAPPGWPLSASASGREYQQRRGRHLPPRLAAEMTQQGAEEDGDLDVADILARMQMQIEANPAARCTDGDGGNRRDLVALVAVPDDWRLAPGRPGPPDIGDQQESAFVGERQMSLQA